MELVLPMGKILFKEIPLILKSNNSENHFKFKNNKTLEQTLKHPEYSKIKKNLNVKYNDSYHLSLGDFLISLKNNGDKEYLCFLNKYGDNLFCRFSINENLSDKGIYCFYENNEIKYIGRCTDNFKKRINQGYGRIHPKKCFIDGQATNCNINSKINKMPNVKFGIYIMTDKSTEQIKEMEKEILTCNQYDWNIQKS